MSTDFVNTFFSSGITAQKSPVEMIDRAIGNSKKK